MDELPTRDSNDQIKEKRIFISYNQADAGYCRKLAAALSMAGAQVWFDKWIVKPGDSIPAAVEGGLRGFDIFVLVWSDAASHSRWVRTEMEAALDKWLKDQACRLVPVILDETPIPVLLRSIRYLDGRDTDHIRIARELLGIETEKDFLIAVQEFIQESGFDFEAFPGIGFFVACPRCGASPDKLRCWEDVDYNRDDRYMCVKCTVCGWSDWSEI